MKKLFTILMFGSLLSGLLAQKKVTFTVDMNSYTGGSFTTVYVSGDFNGWSGNSNALSDANGDGVWEGTIFGTRQQLHQNHQRIHQPLSESNRRHYPKQGLL